MKQVKQQLESQNTTNVYVICRKGIASQRGTKILNELLKDVTPKIVIKDIIGGMTTWAERIDPDNYACL